MHRFRRIALATAALVLPGLALPASAGPRHDRGPPPPIYVPTRSIASSITPYVYPYGGRYRYNSPGPVYYNLPVWYPDPSCRVWRYNFLYWAC